ncbi:MAG: hypothetical protein J6J11_03210 [Treponema sp.]|nr:hypothetical protein [Clostridia bacterium]MBP3607310.1 hypothetical protein [Treponema sp.]
MDKLTEAYYQVITEEMKIPDIIAGLPKDFVMDKMDQLKTREERVAAVKALVSGWKKLTPEERKLFAK